MRPVFNLQDLRQWKTDAPLQLAVLGDPVAHSASPPMHMAALRSCGLAHAYGRLHIKPEELEETTLLLAQSGFLGVNLTIPHKTAILPLLDHIDPHARIMGAVNTVSFQNGRTSGFNTDGRGLVRAIAEDFGVQLGALRVMILGAGGGAGRAIAIQCAIEGCPQMTLVNRTRQKAEVLAAEVRSLALEQGTTSRVAMLGNDAPDLADFARETDLIIQCSSLGMQEHDASPRPSQMLRPGLLVYDTIYSRETQLILDARDRGARTANGLSMLLHQGALAFEIWFHRAAPVDAMRSALLEFRQTFLQ
jgi:shikimate dehydrogenase